MGKGWPARAADAGSGSRLSQTGPEYSPKGRMSPEGGQVAAAGAQSIQAAMRFDPRGRRRTLMRAPVRGTAVTVRDQILAQAAHKLLIRIADYGRAWVLWSKSLSGPRWHCGSKTRSRALLFAAMDRPQGLDSCR